MSHQRLGEMAHPYEPKDLQFEGLQPIVTSPGIIVSLFFASTTVLFLLLVFGLHNGAKLRLGETLVCCWLALSGLIHIIVEAPVVLNADFFRDSAGNFIYDLWKEYGKADSRYLTRDACTIGIEAITAFIEGPMCLLLVVAFVRRHPWRHILTTAVVLGELYGCVLYFITSYYENFVHQRKEPIYFWFYFVFVNGIWIVCPALVIMQMTAEVSEALRLADKHRSRKIN